MRDIGLHRLVTPALHDRPEEEEKEDAGEEFSFLGG